MGFIIEFSCFFNVYVYVYKFIDGYHSYIFTIPKKLRLVGNWVIWDSLAGHLQRHPWPKLQVWFEINIFQDWCLVSHKWDQTASLCGLVLSHLALACIPLRSQWSYTWLRHRQNKASKRWFRTEMRGYTLVDFCRAARLVLNQTDINWQCACSIQVHFFNRKHAQLENGFGPFQSRDSLGVSFPPKALPNFLFQLDLHLSKFKPKNHQPSNPPTMDSKFIFAHDPKAVMCR